MAAIDTSQREANIYGAALALAPSYTSPEIWTTLNRRYVAGKPLSEHHQIARARSEYDSAVRMINLFDRMTIAGIAYEGENPRLYAERLQDLGAPLYSIINAWNLARTLKREQPALIYEADRETLPEVYRHGLLIEFLESRS